MFNSTYFVKDQARPIITPSTQTVCFGLIYDPYKVDHFSSYFKVFQAKISTSKTLRLTLNIYGFADLKLYILKSVVFTIIFKK